MSTTVTASVFTDSTGVEHAIVPGFARTMFDGDRVVTPIASGYPAVGATPTERLAGVRNRVALGRHLLDTLAPVPPHELTEALVVGAGDGAECLWLAHFGAARVVGMNFAPAPPVAAGLPSQVEMIEANIEDATDLPAVSFDRICTWQTLEHVMNPAAALREIARLLRPGGSAFIEYNPFFSIDGAHWPATIDLPWAHARLDPADFRRALDQLHPDHRPDAASFVEHRINRMTQADLRDHIADAGLETLAFLPRVRTEDLLALNEPTVQAVSLLHPRAEPIDLVSRIVRVALRRPGPASGSDKNDEAWRA